MPYLSIRPMIYKEVTVTCDTAAYADGDVLAATQEITGVCKAGRPSILWSMGILDKDDMGMDLDVYFLRTNVSIGTENAAAAITDTVADEILTVIPVTSSDYTDLGSSQFAMKNTADDGMGALLYGDDVGESVYIAIESGGTPTHTASGLTLKLGFLPG